MKINVKANAFCPDNCIYCRYDFKMVEEGYYPVCKLKELCEENFKKGMIFEQNYPTKIDPPGARPAEVINEEEE